MAKLSKQKLFLYNSSLEKMNRELDRVCDPYQENLFDLYVKEVSSHPVLPQTEIAKLFSIRNKGVGSQEKINRVLDNGGISDEEKYNLEEKIAAGREASARIICANTRLVIRIAKKLPYFINERFGWMDMVSEGNIGLFTALGKYEPSRGTAFSTCATWWIREQIQEAGRKNSNPVMIPTEVIRRISVIKKAETFFLAQNGRFPNKVELQNLTGLCALKINRALAARVKYLSLDEQIGESHKMTMGEILPASQPSVEEQVDKLLSKQKLEKCLSLLPAFEEKLLRQIYQFDGGEHFSLEALGKKFGVCGTTMGNYRDSALAHLKELVLQETWL